MYDDETAPRGAQVPRGGAPFEASPSLARPECINVFESDVVYEAADNAGAATALGRRLHKVKHAIADGTLPKFPGPNRPSSGQVDLAALDARSARIEATVLLDGEGNGRAYVGRINGLSGATGAGKTRVVLAAGAEQLQRYGHGFAFVDTDRNGPQAVLAQLREFGVPDRALLPVMAPPPLTCAEEEPFMYFAPEDEAQLLTAVQDILEEFYNTRYDPDPFVVAFDSLPQIMSMLGQDSNNSDHVYDVVRHFMNPLLRAGACVLVTDHPSKGGDGLDPGGAYAKAGVIDGTSIVVKRERQFVPGRGGAARLVITKDRVGSVLAGLPTFTGTGRTQSAGTFVMDSADASGYVRWRIERPSASRSPGGGVTPTAESDADVVSVIAEFDGEFSLADLVAAADLDYAHARYSVDRLAKNGTLEPVKAGGRGRGNAATWRLVQHES